MGGCAQKYHPFGCLQMNCLRRICGLSLRDHVPNVDMINRCNTFSVESQLQSKRFRCLGHILRMPHDRLPKKRLFGQVKDCCPPGCPRLNAVALGDCHGCCITRLYKDAQNRLLWLDKTFPAGIMSWKFIIFVITIIAPIANKLKVVAGLLGQ